MSDPVFPAELYACALLIRLWYDQEGGMVSTQTFRQTVGARGRESLVEVPNIFRLDPTLRGPMAEEVRVAVAATGRWLGACSVRDDTDRLHPAIQMIFPLVEESWVGWIGLSVAPGSPVARVGADRREGEVPFTMNAMKESEQRFSKAFHAMADPFVIAEFPGGEILEVNEGYGRLFGLDGPALLGRNLWEFNIGKDAAEQAWFRSALETRGEIRDGEAHGRLMDGVSMIFRVDAQLFEIGGRRCVFVRLVDITEQRMLELAQLESQEKFSKAFQASPDGIVISTLEEGEIVEVNDSFVRIFGWSRDELVGHSSLELGLWLDGRNREALAERLRSGDGLRDERISLRRKTGDERRCLLAAERVEIAGRICMIGILRDITDQERIEEQMRQAQKMESIGLLAGGVAHDFNNLLTVIQGYLAVAVRDARLPADLQELLSKAQRGAEVAAHLTTQLLVFSSKHVIQLKRVVLGEVVQRSASLLQSAVGDRVKLEVRLPEKVAAIRADLGMIEQVLVNLAVNARDAMPQGGTLTVEVASLETDREYLRRVPQAKPGLFAGVKVSDTGTGIAPEILPRIFDPFFTTKQEGEGSGIGLATVYGIAQQHGGWVEVRTEVGRGSEFAVWFPALVSKAATATPFRKAATARGGETILVVEDQVDVRTILTTLLTQFGYRILAASHGGEALALWTKHRDEIALLFTDVTMPGDYNGRQLAERLRQDRASLRVIYGSGHGADILGADALKAPRTRFIGKPFDFVQLSVVVRELLDES